MVTEEVVKKKDLGTMNNHIVNKWTNKKASGKVPCIHVFAFVNIWFHVSSTAINIPYFFQDFIGRYSNNCIRKIISSSSDGSNTCQHVLQIFELSTCFLLIVNLPESFPFNKNYLSYTNQSSFYRQSRRNKWEQVPIK